MHIDNLLRLTQEGAARVTIAPVIPIESLLAERVVACADVRAPVTTSRRSQLLRSAQPQLSEQIRQIRWCLFALHNAISDSRVLTRACVRRH